MRDGVFTRITAQNLKRKASGGKLPPLAAEGNVNRELVIGYTNCSEDQKWHRRACMES